MMDNQKWVLGMTSDDDAFNSLKTDFNKILRGTLWNMLQKERDEATMSVSLKISLTKGTAPDLDNNAYESDREIIIPKFEHKVTGKMQYSDDVSGITGGSDYELVWDKEVGSYVMRSIKDAQTSLWEDAQEETAEEDAAGPKLLPAADEDGTVIDAEYTVCGGDTFEDDEAESAVEGDLSEETTKAIQIVRDAGKASISLLQRKLSIGYAHASALMENLENLGVVGPYNGSTPREILGVLAQEPDIDDEGYEYEEPGNGDEDA